MAFLAFLWAGEGSLGGQDAPSLWRAIILRDWAIRAVTLSAVALRLAISIQATVCTSMVAALLIERRKVHISQIAKVSICRSVNSGPQQLIQNILFTKSFALIFHLETLILVTLGLGSLGIQFSSTILVPDLNTTSIVGDSTSIRHNVSLSPATQSDIQGFFGSSWANLQGSNALFGELDSADSPLPDEHGVSYTGLKQRAFLPFKRQDRTKLRAFKGTAFALNTEVSCMKPLVEAQVQVHPFSLDIPYASLTGEISYEKTFRDAHIEHSTECYDRNDGAESVCYLTAFNCTIPSQHNIRFPEWGSALCRLDSPGINTEADIDVWQTTNDLYGPTSMIFLAFASNADVNYYDTNITAGPLPAPAAHGEWISYEMYSGAFLNVSLCFSQINTTISQVQMSTKVTLSEPEFLWSPDIHTASVGILQDMMGASEDKKSAQDRGILTIDNIQHPIMAPSSAFSSDVNASSTKDDISFSEWASWHGPSSAIWSWANNNESLNVCTTCQMRGFSSSKDGAALFSSIVNSSQRVAVAIDTYMAKLAQNFFYITLPLFDVPGDVEVVFSPEVRVPQQWNGLIAVLVMGSVDLLCIWIITGLFVANVRYTRQGDVWHAVSQLIAAQTQSALDNGNESRDKEVSKALDETDSFLTIGRSTSTGRAECLPSSLKAPRK